MEIFWKLNINYCNFMKFACNNLIFTLQYSFFEKKIRKIWQEVTLLFWNCHLKIQTFCLWDVCPMLGITVVTENCVSNRMNFGLFFPVIMYENGKNSNISSDLMFFF